MTLYRFIAMALGGALYVGAPAQAAVTYYKQIAPILLAYCAPCHRPGQAGPFSLLTYGDAKKHAREIATVTGRRYMPPWLPEAGYGEFEGELRLSDAQIRLIAEWARAGAPAGALSDAPPPPVFAPGWQLGLPDLIVQAPKPFTLPADGPDLFWNFLLSPPLAKTRYVKAVEVRPGNPRVVHHANLIVDRTRAARSSEKIPGEGFPGMDVALETDSFEPESHFLFWKPGSRPPVEPDGMAWTLNPGSDLVLNVHLQPSGKPEQVQPSVGLYFGEKPPGKFPILVKIENDRALDIPPGAQDFLVSEDFRLPLDVDLLAVYPHAHYLGKLLEGFATMPDGSRQWLIRIPEWNPQWQGVYRYRKPLLLPKDTVVSMRFHYDNSAANPRNPNSPPRRVLNGNQSTDEMGHLWLQLLPRGAGDQKAVLQEALLRHRLEKYPGDSSAHLELGTLLLARKDRAAAIDQFVEALGINPQQPQASNNLGAALEQEGKLDDALERFRRALQIQPNYTNARYNLANALAAKGRLEEAAANFRLVVAAAPEDRNSRDQLSAVLLRIGNGAMSEGRYEAAAASYREMVALDGGNADLRNNLGIILVKLGDVAGAVVEFEAAVKANPAHQAARRNLEQVRGKLPR